MRRPCFHRIDPLIPRATGKLSVTARELGAQVGESWAQERSQGGQGVETPGFPPGAGAVLPQSCGSRDDKVGGSVDEIGLEHRGRSVQRGQRVVDAPHRYAIAGLHRRVGHLG